MRIVNFSLLIPVILSIISCSSSKNNSSVNENIEFHSGIITSSNLIITIPAGWREINDNKDKLFEIWLVNEDNNAGICFTPIHLDDKFSAKNSSEKQRMVLELLISKKALNSADIEILENSNEKINQTYSVMKYKIDGNLHNSIVFGTNTLFYECLAYSKKNSEIPDEKMESIFNIQSEIVRTAQFK